MTESLLLYENQPLFDSFDMTPVFEDFRLAPIIDAVVEAGGRPAIRGFFTQKPKRPEDVWLRLAVSRDLENPALYDGLRAFTRLYALYRQYETLTETADHAEARAKYRLDALSTFTGALQQLERTFSDCHYTAPALKRFHHRLTEYIGSESFRSIMHDANECQKTLLSFVYVLDVRPGDPLLIVEPDNAPVPDDWFATLARVFARMDCDAFRAPVAAFADTHFCLLENLILKHLQKMNPRLFAAVRAFDGKHRGFTPPAFINTFEHELQFFLSYALFQAEWEAKGLYFSLPVLQEGAEVSLADGYELALAINTGSSPVPNDFALCAGETHFVLTGPNHGGKTTFARMLGQCLYFAHIGLPAPCASLRFRFFNGLHSHFVMPETVHKGRLKEELTRLKALLDTEPCNSFVVLNELFASATTRDARELGNLLLERLREAGCVCLYITHIFELAADAPGRVSLRAVMDDGGRSYKIGRLPADGLVFVNELMGKYHLYQRDIEERLHDRFPAASV